MSDVTDKLLRLSSRVSCTDVRIYNIIREVGYGKLTADNALHQLVEDYHDLHVLSDEIRKAADEVEKMQEELSEKERSPSITNGRLKNTTADATHFLAIINIFNIYNCQD